MQSRLKKQNQSMDYNLENLLDVPLLKNLQEKLNDVYSFPSAIIDNEGKILTAIAWQDICTKFHRTNPQCEKECIKSDLYILEHIHEANPTVSYQCPHGMIDNATPIIIDGKHLGNFFTGQFFLEKPDLEFFRNQAKKYGFDEKEYLNAVLKVPILTKEKLTKYLDFIKGFIEIIAGIGLNQLKEIESNKVIKESEERNRAIIQSTSDWIWEVNEQGIYTFCSEKVEEVLGYSVEEIIGKRPFDLMPDEERERIATIFQDIFESKASIVDMENWNIHKEGHLVCLLTNGYPIFDESHNIIGYRGADKNITQRKESEEDLRKSEVQYRTLFENLKQGVFVQDQNGNLVDVNIAALEIFGLTKDQFLGKTSFDPHWDVIDENYKPLNPQKHPSMVALKSGKPVKDFLLAIRNIEKNYIRWVFVNAIPQFNQGESKPYQVFVSLHDITEHRQAEEALRDSEERYRNVVNVSPDAIIMHCEGLIVFANKAAIIIFGAENQVQIIGKPAIEFVHPDDRNLAKIRIAEMYKSGIPAPLVEERLIKFDGSIIYVEIAATLTPYKGKQASLVVLRDITERKQAEVELQQHRENLEDLVQKRTAELEEKNAELERFNSLFVGREFRIKELRDKVKELEERLEKENEF